MSVINRKELAVQYNVALKKGDHISITAAYGDSLAVANKAFDYFCDIYKSENPVVQLKGTFFNLRIEQVEFTHSNPTEERPMRYRVVVTGEVL